MRRHVVACHRSRRWPPRDLAHISRLRCFCAFDFLHQRRRVTARRLLRRLPRSKSNPFGHLFLSSIDGSISEWDLFSLKQKRVELKLEDTQKGEVSSHEKQRLETRIFTSFGVDQPSSLSAPCSLKLLSLLFSVKISR
ncbi:hypothetical protein MRB53_014106 [Persea americana]|uniref:Uncharacterized protein n=1 Tax=Persea americana TaxID=3435 RepID=A0ACC2K9V0_PERAE|nr:hypothetical protein MRB53_014106 [Persea americana]